MNTPGSNNGDAPTSFENAHGYVLHVKPGSVTLNARYKDTTVEMTDGVRAYDTRALRRLQGMSGNQAAMAMRLMNWQKHDVASEQGEYDDDIYQGQSPAAADRWLNSASQWMDKALCRLMLWRGLDDHLDDVAAHADEGAIVLTSAADELQSIANELKGLSARMPARRPREIGEHFVQIERRLVAAIASFTTAATVTRQLGDVRRRTKALYYPSQDKPTLGQ